MDSDLYSLIRFSGLFCVALWFLGFSSRVAAARKARAEFRSKGFLQMPSGSDWIHFLWRKHYDMFKDSTARSLFGFARFCMIAIVVVLVATSVFVGCELLLKSVSRIS